MKFSQETIRLIKDSTNIVDVISDYVRSMKKSGKNWIGLCPFHNDKNPSFSVSEELKRYKCFSCGESGDVIKFVEKIENISFVDAVKILAKKAGIAIEFSENDALQAGHRDEILNFNERLIKLFRHFLTDKVAGANAMSYLKSRGISDDIIDKFNIGFAPSEFGRLERILTKKGFRADFLSETGIFNYSDGRLKTLFFDRVMFPIINYRGECVGFGGRVLKKDAKPKYLNTPETVVYKKSSTLYGINIAKDTMKNSGVAFLVEGYVDVIACHKNGVTNAVAPCGTAVTKDQIKLIDRFASEIVLLLDGDAAGLKGAIKALKEGANIENIKFSVIILPDNMDPDDYFNKFSRADFDELYKNRSDAFDFCIRYITKGVDLKDYNKMIGVLHFLFDYIKLWDNGIIRQMLIDRLGDILSVNKDSLRKEYDKFVGVKPVNTEKNTGKINADNIAAQKKVSNQIALDDDMMRDINLLLYLHSYSGSAELVDLCGLKDEYFSSEYTRKMYIEAKCNNFVKNIFVDGIDNGLLLDYVVGKLLSSDFDADEVIIRNCVVDLITDILGRSLKKKSKDLTERIKLCEMYKDYDLIKALQEEKEIITNDILKLNGLQELKK